jgi:hypothetical protein
MPNDPKGQAIAFDSMPPFSVQLLPDVIDHIVDYLHDSPRDLRTCALISKAWLERSRFHLFRTIILNSPHCRKLYKVIQQSPNIAFYTRQLHVTFIRAWVEDCAELPQLLRCFTNLCKLKLSSIKWRPLTPDLKNVFCDLFALPCLVDLELDGVQLDGLDRIATLLHPHLRQLALRFMLWDAVRGKDAVAPVTGRQPCSLEHFTYSVPGTWGPDIIGYLLKSRSVVDMSNLRTLDARCNEVDLTRLIENSRLSVEHLSIRYFSLC